MKELGLISKIDKLQKTDKLIFPPSVLEHLTKYIESGTFTFKIQSEKKEVSYGSSYGFNGTERIIFGPNWMLSSLGIEDGDKVKITSVNIPSGESITLQCPRLKEMTDPEAILSYHLREHTVLYEGKKLILDYVIPLKLKVIELKPCEAVIANGSEMSIKIIE